MNSNLNNLRMNESREINIDNRYNSDDIIQDVNCEVNKYKTRLTTKEFESHLDECNYAFRDDLMRKVFMLKYNGNS